MYPQSLFHPKKTQRNISTKLIFHKSQERMKIKIALKYGGFLLAITSIILTGNLDAAAQVKKNKLNELSSALSLEEYTAPATVFGGVGRKFPTVQADSIGRVLLCPDLITDDTDHQLALSTRVEWGEGGTVTPLL
jgi:hypothetical protein